MCVVSMIGDHYKDKFRPLEPHLPTTVPFTPGIPTTIPFSPGPSEAPHHSPTDYQPPSYFITREEFEALRKDVEEMKKLLIKAKEYDERNNESNCEMEDKVELLKKVAKYVGVDLSEIFPNLTK